MIILDLSIGLSIGAVIGYIVRELIGDRLARNRALASIQITEFNKGSSAFRSAFVSAIVRLQENTESGDVMVSEIIEPQIVAEHEKAKILFEPFVADLDGFNAAWKAYKNYDYNYFNAGKPSHPAKRSNRQEMSQYCLDQINKLLEYAKPKI